MSLDNPAIVMTQLLEIEKALAMKQNVWEQAAYDWFTKKREREHDRAVAFLTADGTVAHRSAIADRETSLIGAHEEALYESLKAVIRTLESRASTLQSVLRSQGRV